MVKNAEIENTKNEIVDVTVLTPEQALLRAQGDMGNISTDGENDYLSNKYATLGNVQGAVIPIFNRWGFAVLQCGGADEFGKYMKTELIHITGKTFESKIYLVTAKNDMQSIGSAITYARRYGLLAFSGIKVLDDDANEALSKDQLYDKVKNQGRGILRFIEKKNITLKQMDEQKQKAFTIIDHLKTCDPEFGEKLKTMWEIQYDHLQGQESE